MRNTINQKFLSKFEQDTSNFIEKINESELDELYLIKSEYLIPYLNFIKEITLQNYLISTISTIAFTLLFSMIINKYVKNINLTEALKSNE